MQTERSRTAGTIRLHGRVGNSIMATDNEERKTSQIGRPLSSPLKPPIAGERQQSAVLSKHIKSWLSEQSIKILQEKADYESSAVKNMYECLLENEKDLQKGVDEFLQKNDFLTNRKREMLLKKWHQRTYTPLAKKIGEEMDGSNYADLDSRKRILYDNYLDHRNKKGHVFLDVISTDEYDPMSLNSQRPGPLKACVPKLDDPLLQQQHKRNDEDRAAIACSTGQRLSDTAVEKQRLPALPLVPLGRHGTSCNTWLGMKLTDIQSDVRLRAQERLNNQHQRNHSNAPLHECKEQVTELEIFDRKNKWRKRRQFPITHNTADLLI